MTDFKTPISKVRGLGSAKGGTHHWWVQRLTALANIPLTVFVLISFVGNAGADYDGWHLWLAQPIVAVLMLLFVANLFYHIRLGLQVLIEDYVSDHGAKTVYMILLTFATIGLGTLSAFSILKIAFGGV